MECLPTSYAPHILQPDSEHDWTSQHVLSEQIHHAEHKQPILHTTSAPQIRKHQQQQLPTRRSNTNTNNSLLLHIPKPSSRIHKLITPVKSTKSPQEWEALLRTSMTNLRGAYASLQPPAAPKPLPMPSSERRPDFSGLDRVQMASRAMQMAAGFAAPAPSRREQSVDSDSGSEADVEAPATPVAVENGDMMNIDPRLFS